MEHYEVLGSIWFWIMTAAIIALHVAAVFARRISKGMLTVVCAVNMALHLILFGFMFINYAKPEELFFALLLSTVAALITTRRSGKEEHKDGI